MAKPQPLRDRITQIDGGEIVVRESCIPYTISFPKSQIDPVVYTTKFYAASALLAVPDAGLPFGIIGRYGLPSDEDISKIAAVIGQSPVCFLGDCDPFDLLVFAWLRQHLPIRYLGTSDAVLAATGVEIVDSMTIELPDEEKLAMSILRDVWPNFEEATGPHCARLLAENRKLEIEAVLSYRTRNSREMRALIRSAT